MKKFWIIVGIIALAILIGICIFFFVGSDFSEETSNNTNINTSIQNSSERDDPSQKMGEYSENTTYIENSQDSPNQTDSQTSKTERGGDFDFFHQQDSAPQESQIISWFAPVFDVLSGKVPELTDLSMIDMDHINEWVNPKFDDNILYKIAFEHPTFVQHTPKSYDNLVGPELTFAHGDIYMYDLSVDIYTETLTGKKKIGTTTYTIVATKNGLVSVYVSSD